MSLSALEKLRAGFQTDSPETTSAFASSLARELGDNSFIALYGDLGAGKTTFVKGLALGLGIGQTVKSPSFNICSFYKAAPLSLVHIDAYRLSSAEDFENLLIDELFDCPKIVCVEWPEAIDEIIPQSAIRISIKNVGDRRIFSIV